MILFYIGLIIGFSGIIWAMFGLKWTEKVGVHYEKSINKPWEDEIKKGEYTRDWESIALDHIELYYIRNPFIWFKLWKKLNDFSEPEV